MPNIKSHAQAATATLDDAMDRMRDLRSGVQDLASRGLSVMSEGASDARDRLGRYTNATTRYVAEEPVKVAIVAAAVGALVAAAVLYMRKRNNRYYY